MVLSIVLLGIAKSPNYTREASCSIPFVSFSFSTVTIEYLTFDSESYNEALECVFKRCGVDVDRVGCACASCG